jgi:hypothetical protein
MVSRRRYSIGRGRRRHERRILLPSGSDRYKVLQPTYHGPSWGCQATPQRREPWGRNSDLAVMYKTRLFLYKSDRMTPDEFSALPLSQ